MLTVNDLGKSFGGQTLFWGASLQFHPGNIYGVVGANGSGKSTFLRILTGEETASEGEVVIPNKCVVGVLEQDHFKYEDVPIIHVVMMGHEAVWSAMQRKEAMLSGPESEFDADRYAKVEDTILQLGGYALESQAAEILEGMQIPARQHYDPLSTLSGGYKLRVLLARTLAGSPDLLLLDEPNNHLDILSLRWLEKFLENYKGCGIVVSHDHRFLDNVCNHIVDVDYQRVTLYKGNYEAFEKQKAEERERQEREIDKREKEIADHQRFIERFKAKATKARQANSRQKRMEKIIIEELPRSSRQFPRFRFEQCRPPGQKVVEAIGLCKSYDDKVVLKDVDLELERGDKLAIIGPNGIGKSTLLKALMGKIELDDGMVEWGYETHKGYFAQDHHEILADPEQAVSAWLWDRIPGLEIGQVFGRLAAVLFSRDDCDKRLEALSGGEAARLVMAGIAAAEPNVLIFDEPTNHLDLEGISALADALRETDATVVLVSHDRWFVSKVANRILEITHDGVDDYKGTYEEFLRHTGNDHLDRNLVVEEANKKGKKKRR